jgi:hypothetical protein
METAKTSKAVYTIIEKPGDKPFWLRIGWAHVNRDGSYNIHLDATPINGKLQVRDYTPREQRDDGPFGGRSPEPRLAAM